MAQGKIRRYDSKINALSRLVDSGIILFTFLALIDLFHVEWTPLDVWGVFLAIILFNFFAESQDAYRSWRGTQIREEVVSVLSSWLAAVVTLVLVDIFFIQSAFYNDIYLAAWIVVTPIELISWHFMVRMLLRMLRAKGFNTRNVAIIGATDLGVRLKSAFEEMDWSGYRFSGYYDDRTGERLAKNSQGDDIVLTGSLNRLIDDCKNGTIDAVYITLAMSAEKRVKDTAKKLADSTASVYIVPDIFTFNLLNSRWVDFQGITAISIYETPFAGLTSIVKRIEDIVLSLLILILISVPMLFIALGIKLTSTGPVLFKQARYGIDGDKINVWKFRSMTVAENGDSVKQAIRGDSRITPFGAFLRQTSLDELPQFFNSLGGTMSIVGPRPHAVAHNEEYRKQIQGYMLRHKVKPGITGLAQINGFRGETDTLDKMAGRVRYDLRYIQTWSLSLDLKIILLTIFKGFKHKNAY